MSIENEITALLFKAEPLRLLPDDEPSELGKIVDRINELRALQAKGATKAQAAVDEKPV